MTQFAVNVARWLWSALSDLVVNYLRRAFVDWLLDQALALCERVCAWIAAGQERARRDGVDEDTARSRALNQVGVALAEIGARIVERAETMTEEEALEAFRTALSPLSR